MSKAMDIDFAIAVPDQDAGEAIAGRARAVGYAAKVVYDPGEDPGEDPPSWTCYCTRRLVPTYEAVMGAQVQLDAISQPFGGYSDGWGSSGNLEPL